MSKLINISLCVNDIPKGSSKPHTNGKNYLSLDVWINDEEDKYGNDCSVNISQSKEDREAKVKKVYIGNGRTKFGFDKAAPKPSEPSTTYANQDDTDFDDIPF